MKLLIARPRLALAAWLGVWGFTALLTHVPLPKGGTSPIPHLDKVAHFGLYFLLTYLGAARLVASGASVSVRSFVLWGLIYGVYGVVDELTQPWTKRTADLNDWLIDCVGIASATWIAVIRLRKARLSAPRTPPWAVRGAISIRPGLVCNRSLTNGDAGKVERTGGRRGILE